MSKEKTRNLIESEFICLVNLYVFIMMAIYSLVVGNTRNQNSGVMDMFRINDKDANSEK